MLIAFPEIGKNTRGRLEFLTSTCILLNQLFSSINNISRPNSSIVESEHKLNKWQRSAIKAQGFVVSDKKIFFIFPV